MNDLSFPAYCQLHNIQDDEVPQAFAAYLHLMTGGRVNVEVHEHNFHQPPIKRKTDRRLLIIVSLAVFLVALGYSMLSVWVLSADAKSLLLSACVGALSMHAALWAYRTWRR